MYSSRRYYFLTLAETCNISHAAEQLMIAQPSLTQYLKKLEAELQVKLFDRSFSPMRLTPAGKIYYEYLKTAHTNDQKLFADLDQLRGPKNTLSIGLPMQRSRDVYRIVMQRFLQDHPEIRLTTKEGTSKDVRNDLFAGEIDIGFCHVSDCSINGCEVFPISKERIVLITNAENPIVYGKTSSPEHPISVSSEILSTQTLYQMATGYLLRDLSDLHLKQNEIHPQKKIDMSDVISLIDIICSVKDNGFTYIADYFFEDPYIKGKLQNLAFVRIGNSDIDWYFTLIRQKNAILSYEAKMFWDYAIKKCRNNLESKVNN